MREKQRHKELRSLFDQVSTLIRSSPVTPDSISNETKLRLYGLYKRITVGKIHGDNCSGEARNIQRPSLLNLVERYKYDAWASYDDLDEDEAIIKYVKTAANEDNETARECAVLLQDYTTKLQQRTNDPVEGQGVTEEGVTINIGANSKEKSTARLSKDEKIISEFEPPKLSLPPHKPCFIEKYLRIQPFLPRGQLDISYRDLAYALWQCIKTISIPFVTEAPMRATCRLEDQISTTWKTVISPHLKPNISTSDGGDGNSQLHLSRNLEQSVVVGLSVRSLLDLYLSAKSYPPGSEIIITPPINIEGMIQIIRYHDLTIIPIDIPQSEEEGGGPVVGVDLDAVQGAITDLTVAIMVVHPFGLVCSSDEEMENLRDLAVFQGPEDGGIRRKIDIMEDCSECFNGGGTSRAESNDMRVNSNYHYAGSRYADVHFFSFGMIKTATALGGGIAILRGNSTNKGVRADIDVDDNSDVQETAQTMRRIQHNYVPQSRSEYLTRVVKSMLLLFLSRHTLICGLIIIIMNYFGFDYDSLVTSAIRGFHTGSTKAVKSSTNDTDQQKVMMRNLILKIRRRPSPALLSLLSRRICQVNISTRVVSSRAKRCLKVGNMLNMYTKKLRSPIGPDGSRHFYWLYPVLVSDPEVCSRMMKDLNFDVARGSSQLACITSFIHQTKKEKCPRAKRMMDHILYLPIASQNISDNQIKRLIHALLKSSSVTDHQTLYVKGKQANFRAMFLIGGIILALLTCQLLSIQTINIFLLLRFFIHSIASIALIVISIAFVLLHILRLKMGPYYLDSSNIFAKYSPMLSQDNLNLKTENPYITSQPNCIDLKTENSYIPSPLNGSGLKWVSGAEDLFKMNELQVPDLRNVIKNNDDCNSNAIVLSGASGFIGSLLLRDLLYYRDRLCIGGGVVVICRSKRNKSASLRIEELLSKPMFDFLTNRDKKNMVTVIEGDLQLPNLGMTMKDMDFICNQINVTHVINCAGCVNFTESLENAATSNITSALQLQALTKKLKKKDALYVYTSTAFVHGGETGSSESPLTNNLYCLGQHDPVELYKSMIETQSYAYTVMRNLRFPNTYTFSKCVCEHLLSKDKEVRTIIIRPCIVGPSLQQPFEGWAGDKPSTLVAAACLYLKYQYNLWCFGRDIAPVIPVDIVTKFILSKSFQPYTGKFKSSCHELGNILSEDSATFSPQESVIQEKIRVAIGKDGIDHGADNTRIYTAAWDTLSPESSGFLWYDYAFTIVQLGSVTGHCDRALVYIGLFVTFKIFLVVKLTYNTFRYLHGLFVYTPIKLLNGICNKVGWKPASLRSLEKLIPFLDLPLLFFPFTTAKFHFRTDLLAPKSMNGERYMFNCALSAERFVTAINSKIVAKGRTTNRNTTDLPGKRSKFHIVGGQNHVSTSSDVWWVMAQPKGNYAIRLIGWIFIKVLRRITTEVSVDLASFAQTERAIEELTSQEGCKQPCIVLAPTHRSILDFIILSFVTFAIPEIGLEIPSIAAADDFSRIPLLGWLAGAAGAFFLKRGKGVTDPGLYAQLKCLKEKRCPLCVEVFLEGRRSRDRRFVPPKTGFLKCLCDTGSDHLIVPITINYEAVPEQKGFSREVDGESHGKLSFSNLVKWLKKVWDGEVQIGRVHLSAASPLIMKPSSRSKVASLGRTIQHLQQSQIYISNYHIDAGASVLDIDSVTMQEALSILNCQYWPPLDCAGTVKSLPLPDSAGERWNIFLHYGFYFAPMLSHSHPKWSFWLKSGCDECNTKATEGDSISIIVKSLVCNFDAADNAIDETLTWLRGKGFLRPDFNHIFQYALKLNQNITPLLLATAIKFRLDPINTNKTSIGESLPIEPLFQQNYHMHKTRKISTMTDNFVAKLASIESFGAWGFRDSKFIVRVSRNGAKYVFMKGKRYRISGRQLHNLIPFLEKESRLKVNTLQVTLPQACNNLSLCESDLTLDDFEKLYKVFGDDKSRLSVQSIDRARHGTGHSQEDMYMIRSGQISEIRVPDIVVFPKDESEVERLVYLACKEKWCLIPFGGGTNVSHATHCPSKKDDPRPMISVDMKLMSQVLQVNEEDSTAHVQAGIKGIDLTQHMESLGFTIGHEPDSIEFSTLGGWIATKASGMKQNKYGNIENIVKEVRVVGANGVLWQNQGGNAPSFGRVSTGLDLSSLLLGSEGSFGIITSAVIKIWPLPEVKEYESIIMHEFDDGIRLLRDIAKMGAMKPASVRLLDNQQFRLGQAIKPSNIMAQIKKMLMGILANVFIETFDRNNVACATIAFEGTCTEVKLQRALVKKIAMKHGGLCAGSEIGKAGYDMTYAIAYLRDFAMTYGFLADSFETFVPWSRVSGMITATKDCIKRQHLENALPGKPLISCRITQLYDEGVCVYFYFCMNFTNVENPSKVFNKIENIARRTIIEAGGSLSHHHGVGKLRAPFMDKVNPKNTKKVCMALKNAFDPENVFGVNNGIYHSYN